MRPFTVGKDERFLYITGCQGTLYARVLRSTPTRLKPASRSGQRYGHLSPARSTCRSSLATIHLCLMPGATTDTCMKLV